MMSEEKQAEVSSEPFGDEPETTNAAASLDAQGADEQRAGEQGTREKVEMIEAAMDVAAEVMRAKEEQAEEEQRRHAPAPPAAQEVPQEVLPAADTGDEITATHAELKPVIETLLFVADEPLTFTQLTKILGDVEASDVRAALEELMHEYERRAGGLEIREIAGGYRISTRPEHHEFIRKYLKSKPNARLSLPALETLAVIAYKQPITIPEILEIRGVSSTSAIKTLLEKRLIVTKGRKETVGRPMMYGTSKEFLLQFGLRDLSELPSIEDFEDLAG